MWYYRRIYIHKCTVSDFFLVDMLENIRQSHSAEYISMSLDDNLKNAVMAD
jgi:hypothetical protein